MQSQPVPRPHYRTLAALTLLLLCAGPLLAGTTPVSTNPWQTAVNNVQTALTGPVGRGLSLIAIAISGIMFAFGEPGAKKTVAGVVFGVAMILGAATWLTWLGF